VKRAVASGVVALARILAGGNVRRIGFEPDERQRIYFANHTSQLDFVVIWAALPKRLRFLTRPVAARDYWQSGVKRYLALNVFNAVLVDRGRTDASTPNPLDVLLDGLGEKHSLIIFPEGTRGDGTQLGAFKSGLYRLGRERPGVELVPVYIDNLNRVLPKGEFAPVPMLASVSFGAPMRIEENEDKAAFLERARNAILELRQW
jgi:1-acyl-sn-glycerol-3-phosphate acyltransferase